MESDEYMFMDSDRYTEEELKNLLQRAQRGASMWKGKVPRADDGLTDEELAAVVEELKKPDQPITRLVLMEILRYAGREAWQSNKQILEPFLEVPDAALARKALFILCEWDLAHEHLEQIGDFIRGVTWDPNNWVRATALDAATSYLSDHAEPGLLRIMIESCEKEGMTGFAYNELYHIVGDPEGPPATVIEMARERLAREEARNADF